MIKMLMHVIYEKIPKTIFKDHKALKSQNII